MFWRSVSLKSSGGLVVRIIMAYHNQAGSYAQRTEYGRGGGKRQGKWGRGGAKPYDEYGERHTESFTKSFPQSEAPKDNGVQGSEFSNAGSHQNCGNNRGQPGSYPYVEMSGAGRGRGRGHRNDDREGAQPGHHHGDLQKVDRAQSHQQRGQPDPYQSDSQKGNRTQGHEQQAQSGPNQRDSQKGDMAQRNFMKDDMAQGYRQGAEPDSYQGGSQEGSGGAQGHGQGAEPISYQGDSQENIDRGQHYGNDSRQGFQAVFDQKDSQKGTQGVMAQGLEQVTEPGSDKGDSQVVQPIFDQNVSQKGKEGDHVLGTEPRSNKGNSKEGNDIGQNHGNDSIQRTQPGSHQKDSQKGSDRGQSHGNDSGQWNKHGSNQGNWRKGGDSSGGHYQENRSHIYQGQMDSGQDGRYSRQASSGGGFRRDNFDQQQRKRNRVDDEDDIFLSKTLSFLLRHGAEKLKFKLMPGGFLYVDEILKKMQKLEGFTVEDVLRIVAQNDKQRFAIQKEDGTGRLKIRANQGHTVEVEDLELTPITSADQVPMVLHGTYYDAWNSIKKQGLCRFKRNHIHFAAGEPGENGVISGMRSSCEVLIYIDLEKALKDGLKFYLSANRVILSPGNEQGYIYPCYFQAVVNRYPFHILEFDPNIRGKTVSADQISDELDKKKKKKKKNKKNKEERESNESVAPKEEIEGVGDTNLSAGAGEKLKEEGKDEEDQHEDAMETQSEKCMQINVHDQWDATDNIEQNSKGTEQSEGTQGVSGSEDSMGTKEPKTKEKDSWSETSKEASKSKAQSSSQVLKAITKPKTPKGSVIPEGEQKAIKTGAFTPEDEDEGTAAVTTKDAEDVRIEEEWMEVYITSVEESQSAVEYILEQKQKEPVSIICCGEKQGDADGKITLLVISIQGRSWIYQLCNTERDLMGVGKLKELFFDYDLMKVFHDVAWQSGVLFKQYEIVLDGTKVFDSKVVCQQNLLDGKAMDSLRLEGFMPSRWMEEDSKIDNSKWTQDPLDKELINKLVERCKALLQFYKMFTMQKLSQPKKEIYTVVNKYVDRKRAKEKRKKFKSQTEEHQDHSASNGKGQNYRRRDDIERLWWKNRLESFGAYGQKPVKAFFKNVPGTESSKDHGIQGHGKKLMEYNHGEHGVSVSQTYHLGREHHEALDYQNQGSVEEVSRKGKINREAKEGIEKEEILEHAVYEYEEKDTDPICLGVTPTELKLPSTLREQRNPAEELLLELAVGSADAEDETEPCNRDQRRGRMDTLSGSPAPSSRDKTEDLLGLSPPWPVALDPAPEYNQLHFDPNNFFLGAPSTVIKSHAATVLQNVRRRAICHKDGRKVEFLSPDSAACVLKKEICVLPDGSIYELTSTWIPDPECKEKKEQSSQTEKSITETMETGIQCDIIKLNI